MTDADRIEQLEAALRRIVEWADAYPLKIFREPDLKRAHEILQQHGMGVDAISASAMRHCLTGARKIAGDALGGSPAD